MKRSPAYAYLGGLLTLMLSCQLASAQNPQLVVARVVHHFLEIHHHFDSEEDVWSDPGLDLSLDAILVYSKVSGDTAQLALLKKIFEKRNSVPEDTITYKSQPFYSINFTRFEVTGNKTFLSPYLYESAKMRGDATFSPEGAVTYHYRGVTGHYLLIDHMQEFASRMARAGFISGDTAYYSLCTQQFRIYQSLLQNPETGLWSQGRGWRLDPQAISPGAWSKGHGLLLRGLVGSLRFLPHSSIWYKEVQEILVKTADALLKVQDSEGMWHQLLDQPFTESYAETSGTGLIAWNLALALQDGILQGKKYEDSAKKACKAMRQYATKEGVVLGACTGDGPLDSVDAHLHRPAEPDSPEGVPAMIYAMAAEMLLERARK
jgi:unsaturated rhamnogalacturonyl hydrolase